MALPKAIQEQVDQLDQFEQETAAAQAIGDPGQTEPNPDQAQTAPVVDAAPAQTQAAPDHQAVGLTPAEVQRLKTIEGKYSAEVPRLHNTLREQETALGAMRSELEAMRGRLDDAGRQAAEKVVTTKDDDVFGADLVEMVRRVAGAEFRNQSSSFITEVDKRLMPLREQVGQVSQNQAVTAEDRFWSKLNADVPDWEAINAGEGWQRWLNEYDPVAGATRQAALDNAQNKMDAGRIAAMFKLFKSQDPAFAKPSAAPQPNAAQQELRHQVAPSKTKASAPIPAGEKVWTQAEYLSAMNPRRQAEIGHEAWVRLQDEADRAFQEGRIR